MAYLLCLPALPPELTEYLYADCALKERERLFNRKNKEDKEGKKGGKKKVGRKHNLGWKEKERENISRMEKGYKKK